MNYDLVYLDKTVQFISKVASYDEAKEIRDKAKAMQAYAKQKEDGQEISRLCGEIILRADRRMGALLPSLDDTRSLAAKRGHEKLKNPRVSSENAQDNLSTKERTTRFRQRHAAGIPNAIFEQYIEDCEEEGKTPTEAGLRRYHSSIAHQEELEKKRRKRQPLEDRFPEIHSAILAFDNMRAMIDDVILPKWSTLEREFLAEDQDPKEIVRFLTYCKRTREAVEQIEQKVLAMRAKEEGKRFRVVK